MATITPVKQSTDGLTGILVYLWETLTSTNTTGVAIRCPQYTDKTVQITGTFGPGTLTLQGSNVPIPGANDWFTLTDPQGNGIAKTAASGETVVESPLWIRPIVSAGDGTTDLDVTILCRASA